MYQMAHISKSTNASNGTKTDRSGALHHCSSDPLRKVPW
jgi:hypothetical protein